MIITHLRAKPRPGTPIYTGHWMLRDLRFWAVMWEQGGSPLWDIIGRRRGTLDGSTPPTWEIHPGFGWCLRFNGDTSGSEVDFDSASVSELDNDGTDPQSVMAWGYLDSATKRDGSNYIISKQSSAAGQPGWTLGVTGSTGSCFYQMRNSASNRISHSSGSGFVDNEWIHATATYDGSQTQAGANMYFNGDDVTGTGDDTLTASSSNSADVTIGNRADQSGTSEWGGLIDDVRVYTRRLTAQEVREIYEDPWAPFRRKVSVAVAVPTVPTVSDYRYPLRGAF